MNGTETALRAPRVVCLPLKVFAELQRMTNMGMRGSVAVHFKVQKEAPDNRKTTLRLPIVESPSKKCKWKLHPLCALFVVSVFFLQENGQKD